VGVVVGWRKVDREGVGLGPKVWIVCYFDFAIVMGMV
jgi:hypothetical protein